MNYVFDTNGLLVAYFRLQPELQSKEIQKHVDAGHTLILSDDPNSQLCLNIINQSKDVGWDDGQVVAVNPLPTPESDYISYEVSGIQQDSSGEYNYVYTVIDITPVPSFDDFDLVELLDDGMIYPDALKAKRNHFLGVTDKIILDPDLTAEQLTAWKTYRQQLRDLPTQEGWPDNITWPTQPV